MKKTPSTLKCLAEMRARFAGDVARLEFHYTATVGRLQTARERLAAIDATLRILDERLDPAKIPPIASRRTRVGRATLRDTLIEILRSAAPDALATNDIALVVAGELDVDVSPGLPVLWKKFAGNSVRNGLKRLVIEGLVARLESAINGSEEVRWCWIGEVQESADELRARALAAGLEVNEGR